MDKLSRKGFFSMVAGLFAAPAVVKAITEKPKPIGIGEMNEIWDRAHEQRGMDDFSHWVIYKRGDNGSPSDRLLLHETILCSVGLEGQ